MESYFQSLTSFQKDALREVGNIGSGNAATALSKLIGERVNMSVPQIQVLPFSEVAEVIGGSEVVVAGVYIKITGCAKGSILFLLPLADAEQLLFLLLKRKPQVPFNELENSTLKEIGNILCGSFFYALSTFTSLTFYSSVPGICVDMSGAILGTVFYHLGEIDDYALFIETAFSFEKQQILGYFFFLPEADSLATILTALGVNSG